MTQEELDKYFEKGYKPVVGMEIHVQLASASKLFSSAANNADEKSPNVNIDEVVTAQPGTLPVLNQEALELGLRLGLALNCEIPYKSKFDRKHYFYPDLPKGYQISQYDEPIAQHGYVEINVNGITKKIRITRAHIEEDAGKNTHPAGMPYSLVDYNRAGCPLLEIVTEPDIESALEAKIFLQTLRNIVRYVGASSADMEKGTMRCEPNISVRKPGEITLPKYKVEVKNINSFRFVEAAINYEIPRHIEMLEKGELPEQVTMGWNEKDNITVRQRSKEDANDYRYFPEPDLPIMHFETDYIQSLRDSLPEMPDAKAARFKTEFDLNTDDINNLINYKELASFFENVVSELIVLVKDEGFNLEQQGRLIKQAAKWSLQDFSNLLNTALINPEDSKVSPANFAELLVLIEKGAVSSSAAKQVLKNMFDTGGEPDHIITDLGLSQISDTSVIDAIIDEVLSANAKAVEDYKGGAEKSFGFLVGQVMAKAKGQANPSMVNEILKKKLE